MVEQLELLPIGCQPRPVRIEPGALDRLNTGPEKAWLIV
jgi:hypothetical protein